MCVCVCVCVSEFGWRGRTVRDLKLQRVISKVCGEVSLVPGRAKEDAKYHYP